MTDDFADLFFRVSDAFRDYQSASEEHIVELRRAIQDVDHLAPHLLDNDGWTRHLEGRRSRG